MGNEYLPSFWSWFWRGTGAGPGIFRVVNRWLFAHLIVGGISVQLVDADLNTVARGALMPLLAVLVGLAFSWAGNAHAVLQNSETQRFMESKPGGACDYVFTFQLCILVHIVTICVWAIPLLEIEYLLPVIPQEDFEAASKWLLFTLLSLAVREGWHAVLGANMLLLRRIKG